MGTGINKMHCKRFRASTKEERFYEEAESYVRAMSLLPAGLQDQVRLSEALMAKAEEIRLRRRVAGLGRAAGG